MSSRTSNTQENKERLTTHFMNVLQNQEIHAESEVDVEYEKTLMKQNFMRGHSNYIRKHVILAVMSYSFASVYAVRMAS